MPSTAAILLQRARPAHLVVMVTSRMFIFLRVLQQNPATPYYLLSVDLCWEADQGLVAHCRIAAMLATSFLLQRARKRHYARCGRIRAYAIADVA